MKSLLSITGFALLSLLSPRAPQGPAPTFAAAERAFDDGRYGEAMASLMALAAERGVDAPAELWFDVAVAAVRVGDLPAAEAALRQVDERVAARGADALAAQRSFVLGAIAWQRGEAAARLATQVEAEPFAFRPALVQVTAARDHWLRALVRHRGDWPAARRNVERAMLRLAELERLRQAAEDQRRQAQGGGEAQPKLLPDGDRQDDPAATPQGQPAGSEAHTPAPLQVELSAEQLRGFFEQLDRRERDKQQTRRERALQQRRVVERDW